MLKKEQCQILDFQQANRDLSPGKVKADFESFKIIPGIFSNILFKGLYIMSLPTFKLKFLNLIEAAG